MVKSKFILLTVLAAVVSIIAFCSARRKDKLQIISLMPFVNGANSLPTCLAAMQVVIDVANRREDILPEYDIVLHPEDEGPGANFGPKTLFNFINKFNADRERDPHTFLSPITLGPTTACQTTVLSLKLLKFTAFSELCNGPLLFARKELYSNLYRFIWPGDYTSPAIALFMTAVGEWKQMAILTSSGNQNDVQAAMGVQKFASQRNVDTVVFAVDSGLMADETMLSLKNSDARIIVVAISGIPQCILFQCRAYAFGMRAPQYLFLLQLNCYFPLYSQQSIALPKNCTWDNVYEQLKITIFYGAYRGMGQTTANTTLGYDAAWFNRKVDERVNFTKAADDEMRAMCHDITMSAVIALNQTETILRSKYRSSLRDFRSDPDLVASIANASAASLDVVGLRIGRIRYSQELELESDSLCFAQQQIPEGQLKIVYNVKKNDSHADYTAVDAFTLTRIDKFTWMTKSGRPPKDLSRVFTHRDTISTSSMGVVAALASLLLLVQMYQAFLVLVKCQPYYKSSLAPYFDVRIKAMLYLGFFTLDIAGILFVLGPQYFPMAECRLKHVLTTIGISLIDSVLFAYLFRYSVLLRVLMKHRYMVDGESSTASRKGKSPPRKGGTKALTALQFNYSPRYHITFYLAMLPILLASGAVLAIWLIGIDPVFLVNHESPVAYDETTDSYMRITSLWCVSKYQSNWIAALIGIHGLALLTSCYYAFQIEHCQKPKELMTDCKMLKISVVNTTGIFFGIILIIVVLSLSGRQQWVLNMVVSCGDLFVSFSVGWALFYHCRVDINRIASSTNLRKLGIGLTNLRPSALAGRIQDMSSAYAARRRSIAQSKRIA